MSNRTTLNVSKNAHQKAQPVKEQYDESWSDVLYFYAEYRDTLSIGQSEDVQDLDRIINKIDELKTAVHEATDAAQSAQRSVEDLQP